MIDLRVKKRLGDFNVDAEFSSDAAGVTVLFGRSGSGKTSVINMLAGLLKPDQGQIIVKGRTLFDASAGIDLPPEQRRVGYVFQDGRLFPHLSVRANLNYGIKRSEDRHGYIEMQQVLDLLNIEHLLDRRPAKLSGGEKQRVAIGRALMTSPRILLMDEPLASLDGERKTEVMNFIVKLRYEFSIPIVYVTHSVRELTQLADTVVFMESGRVASVESGEEAIERTTGDGWGELG